MPNPNWQCHHCDHINFEGEECEKCKREKREKLHPAWQQTAPGRDPEWDFRKYEEPGRPGCKWEQKRGKRRKKEGLDW